MKKLLLLIALLLPLTASAARPAKRVSRAEMASIISDFRHYDGVEVVKMGWLGTALVKGLAHHVDDGDADTRAMLQTLRGIKGVTIVDYDDADPAVRERLNKKIERALNRCELLMEARDGGSGMQLFGVVDEAKGTVRDLVMHASGDNTLICFFGTVSMDAVGKLLAQ
ncbi:MAG: DUF4252 domain-containing protein [Bacteroidales bacterium]|nr:DUF4252 domain-containing protein [Bacteroidales bacterium]